MNDRPIIAITCGEPAGIGPEIALRAAWDLRASVHAVLIGDAAFLKRIAAAIDPTIRLIALPQQALRDHALPNLPTNQLTVVDCPLAVPVVPGKLDAGNGLAVLQTLDIAIEGAMRGRFDAIA